MMRKVIGIAILTMALAGCGGTSSTGTPVGQGSSVSTEPTSKPAPTPSPSPTSRPDPYEVYLSKAPKGEKTLSREDAQTRALLGCDQEWAPGTVDAALREAYGHLCEGAPK